MSIIFDLGMILRGMYAIQPNSAKQTVNNITFFYKRKY